MSLIYSNPLRLIGILIILPMMSCSGGGSSEPGGGSGGSTPIPTVVPTQGTVSGAVQAPGGQIAFRSTPSLFYRFASLFLSEANATITGLLPVGDGIPVELGRLGQISPYVFTPIISTRTSGGRYSFNLTSLGIGLASDLVIRVGSGTTQMRAFVTGPIVDLSPVSEAAVQTVLENLGGQRSLGQLTIQELADINGAANILAHLSAGTSGNVQQSIAAFKALIVANGPLSDFVFSAIGPGQTTQAVGDIGNFFPLSQGNAWEYRKTRSSSGSSQQVYTNTHSVSGTKGINGFTTLILRESNPENDTSPEEDYVVKDATGITVHGAEPVDVITPQIVPYQAIRFPLSVFSGLVSLNKRRIAISGFPIDLTVEFKVEGFESVSVPSGTYPNALKAITNQIATLAGDSTAIATATETVWLVSSIGPVKSVLVASDDMSTNQTDVEELTRATLDGIELTTGAQIRRITLETNDIIYDRLSNRIYASVPGNPGSIVAINPETGAVGPTTPVGDQPNRLAISDDGEYIYVGLDGEASFRRIHIPTMDMSPKFSLGIGSNEQGCGPLSVEDIEVLPGNAHSVAVAKRNRGCTPRHEGVAIFDDGIQRPITTASHIGSNQIEFSQSAATLYGFDTESSQQGFRTMAVNSQGVAVTNLTTNVWGTFGTNEIKYDLGRIYEQFGRVFDPVSKTIVGSLNSFGSIVDIVPDASSGRVYSFVIPQAGTAVMQSHDISTLQVISSAVIGSAGTPS